jgi:hypothetical protein
VRALYRRGREGIEKEDNTEAEEVERKEKLKTKWAQFEAIVGSENRVKIIARDLVAHFEERLAAMDGKAMIVCMSRRICVDLYRELIVLRPEWHGAEDETGILPRYPDILVPVPTPVAESLEGTGRGQRRRDFTRLGGGGCGAASTGFALRPKRRVPPLRAGPAAPSRPPT